MTQLAQENPQLLSLKSQREDPLDALQGVLASMRFGVVTLVVHDSRIVQMEITEKKRFQG